jgi:hypothetical protein
MLRSIAGIVAPPSGPALPCRWQQTDSSWQLPLIITTARKLAEAGADGLYLLAPLPRRSIRRSSISLCLRTRSLNSPSACRNGLSPVVSGRSI